MRFEWDHHVEAGDPAPVRFEKSVHTLLCAFDDVEDVRRDVRVPGRLSNAERPVDAWVRGSVGGLDLTVAVDYVRQDDPVRLATVDAFAGKLLDVGADRGVLYSHSDYTTRASTRAANARTPLMLAVELGTNDPIIVYGEDAPGEEDGGAWLDNDFCALRATSIGPFQYGVFLTSGDWV